MGSAEGALECGSLLPLWLGRLAGGGPCRLRCREQARRRKRQQAAALQSCAAYSTPAEFSCRF